MWLTEDDVAERLPDLKRDATAWLGTRFTGQFSLAGAQAKTALLNEDGRWGVPSGAAATSHILKPAIAGLDDHDLNEHVCMTAARRADLGLDREAVIERVDALAAAAPDALRDAAASPDVASLGRPLPALLVDLVAERVARCRDILRPAARRI